MDLKQIQYFLTVAETRNFSAAADELYISQSSLSKQISTLEKELEVQLFDRSKRQIELTAAGEACLKYAQHLHTDYRDLLAALADFRPAPALSIVAIPVIAQYDLTAYIAQFRRAYPDLHFTLEEREASVILPALDNRQYDLAFVRDNYLDQERYATVEITTDRFVVIVSTKHRYASRNALALAELSDENFIMFDKGTVVHELAVEACQRAGFEPRVFYASLRIASIVGLVAQNIGVALMMKRVIDYDQRPDVVAIPLKEAIDSRIVLTYLKGRRLTTSARTFVGFMGKTLALHPRNTPRESD